MTTIWWCNKRHGVSYSST